MLSSSSWLNSQPEDREVMKTISKRFHVGVDLVDHPQAAAKALGSHSGVLAINTSKELAIRFASIRGFARQIRCSFDAVRGGEY